MPETIQKRPLARFTILAVVFFMMLGLLLSRLYALTVMQGDTYSNAANAEATDTIVTKGKRGTIYDRNGLVLAYDETCYNVEFLRDGDNRSNYDSTVYTDALIEAIRIIYEGGGSTIDTSYIRMDENGELYYAWGSQSERTIKARYKNFCDACGFIISEKNKDDMSKWITAEDAYLKLRKSWSIPEEMPFDEAVKIISIRQEVLLNDYQSYKPITIAYNVSMDVVAQLEMKNLPGVQTAKSTIRVYPYGETAAHILGYCQRMNEENADKYLKLGYDYSDYVGVSGVEATMEDYLTACRTENHGKIVLRTNANKSVIEVVSETPATDGSDVTLTIDLRMQTVAAAALEHIIENIHEKQLEKIDPNGDGDYDGDYAQYENIKLAKTGAIVVLDVKTGDLIASASYPSFDPNWFIQGITPELAKYLYTSDEAADTTPTRNKAISMKLAPGSIFKMCTGFAGLMEGVTTLSETIDDESPYYVHDAETGELILQNPVKCWTNNPRKHSDQTVAEALKNSCNYYFCEIASRLGIDRLTNWADKLGLSSRTNVELTGETTGTIGGQAALYDYTKPHDSQSTSLPLLVFRRLCELLTRYQNVRGVEADEDEIEACAERLMQLQDGSLTGKGADVRLILSEELGIPDGISRSRGWVVEIMSVLNEIQWKSTLTIRTGIGQSILLVTPIAAARYVAAIANGGTVYDVHVVDRVTSPSGELLLDVEPTVFNRIEAPAQYWEAIRTGMAGVVSPEDGGTAGDAFSREFKEAGYLAKISGKTGSAQVGNVTIDIQNTSWFVAFAPNDDPDIAICVCIPNGLSGSSSAGAIEEILTYYFKKLDASSPESLAAPDEVTP